MNLTQVKYVDDTHKEFYKFCNSLRCPLCGAQLDGLISDKKAALYCVNNNDEYKCHWIPGESEPDRETIKYWYSEYEYEILINKLSSGTYSTVINRYSANVNSRFRTSSRKEMFSCGAKVIFFRKRMEEEEFLKKLKTYNVFS